MACDVSAGRIEPCKDSVGGLNAIYIVNSGDITGYTFDATNTDAIETVTGTPHAYRYDLNDQASVFEQTTTSSRDNGTTFWEQTLTVNLKKLSITDHKEFKLLAWGNPQIIVEDKNSNFFLMGKEHGADVTGGTITTGAAMGDLSGYTVEFKSMERVPANFFEATDREGLATAGFIVVNGDGTFFS